MMASSNIACLLVAMVCLLILPSNNAAKLLSARQIDSPPLIKNCSTQEEQEIRKAFEQECRDTFDQATDFTNVETVLTRLANPSDIVKLCSEPCLPSVLALLRGCYGVHDGLAALYEDGCLFNKNGTMCYTATYNSLTTISPGWQTKVRAECYVNFTTFTNPVLAASCSDSCKEGLQQVRYELGCCVNAIYNNSFVGEHLPFADYALWSNCGLESELPGYCASAGVKSVGVDALFAIFALGTIILASV